VIATYSTVVGSASGRRAEKGFFAGPEPRLFAHRGASRRAPENTIEAFRIAWDEGAAYLELDVRLTADGNVVVIHDSSVYRITGRRGRVEEMPLDEIRRLDAGWRYTPDRGRTFPYRGRGLVVPLFEEVIEGFPEARLNIEIKRSREGAEEAVADILRRLGATDRVLVTAREHDILQRFRTLDVGAATGFSKKEIREFLARSRSCDVDDPPPPGAALQVPERFCFRRIVSPPLVAAAHRLGIEVHVWTVNEADRIKRLLGWGVDGIMTDDPGRAFASVMELGGARHRDFVQRQK
jgi:glycerophosphoryl diester phosphodiesterase